MHLTDEQHWNTPIMLAARAGNLLIVQYLVEKGADINQKNRYGHSPYREALHYMRTTTASYLEGLGGR